MKIINKNILLISPEPWDHIFVSKHHYATHLGAKGNKIYFLNPPSGKLNCNPTDYENVSLINYKGFIKGIRFMPSFAQQFFMRKKFKLLQKLCGVKFDIVWSFDNSVFFDFSALPKQVYCVSHIVDLNQDFNTKKAAQTANLCIGVIPKLVDRLSNFNDKSILVRHGVQLLKENYSSVKLPGQNSIKSLYIGNLDMPHIDWQLIKKLVLAFTEVDFVFLGSKSQNSKCINNLIELPNVFYLPSVAAVLVPQYLKKADLLLLTYKLSYYEEYASPHKMLEYLASGKVVVSCWACEYEQLAIENLICIGKSHLEFISKFKEVILNLESWNRHDKRIARQEYAMDFTYDKQIERIEGIISLD